MMSFRSTKANLPKKITAVLLWHGSFLLSKSVEQKKNSHIVMRGVVMKFDFLKNKSKKEYKINPKKYRRLLLKEWWGDVRHIIVFVLVAFFIAGCISAYQAAIPIYKEFKDDMFDALSTMDSNTFLRSGNTNIYDTDGELIGRIGNEKYEYVEIDKISPYVTKGYIAKEDRNFTMHPGFDIKGTVRAGVAYIKNRGRITQGGSTITQQIIKNSLLTQDQNFKRKITEVLIALQLEKEFNKAQIMEFYCNSNYYGNGCYGIEGASQYYYGHSAEELTLAEAAILVATSNSPNNNNPVVNYERAMEKKKEVLNDMLECKYITMEEYNKALEEEPVIVQKSENVENENYMITYAIHCAALKLMEYNGFEFKYTFESTQEYDSYEEEYSEAYATAVSDIRSGGYIINTSLNPKIQDILQKSIDKGLEKYKDKTEDGIYELQSAGVCVDNETGLVVAVVGGREEKGSYNRGYQAKRQSGSAIKPLLDYGPAYNEGVYTPASILVDEPVDIDGYKPKNAWKGYVGDISSREALLRSYNTIAVKTYMETTKPIAMSYLGSMKFNTLTYSDMIAPAVAVGGFTLGVTPVDMAKGYATIINKGQYVDNDCIMSLLSYDGKEIFKESKKSHEVFNNDTAFMLTDILSGMFQESYMPGSKIKKSDQIYMGKTGTTNNNKDAWFCGGSVYYTTSIWVGYDTPKEMEGIAGGTKPCEMWTSFMDQLHDELKLKKKEFSVPSTIRLSNSSGDIISVDYKQDVYKSRPAGYDYVSMILVDKRNDELRKENEKDLEKKAKDKTDEFEQFQITTVQEAQAIDQMYNEAYMLTDRVSDQDLRNELLRRIAYKYELLDGDVKEKWEAAIDAYKKSMQAQLDEQNGMAAELSAELAVEAETNAKVSYVQSYVNLLNMQNAYSTAAETWIVAARDILVTFDENSNEYITMMPAYEEAVQRMRTLQTMGVLDENAPHELYNSMQQGFNASEIERHAEENENNTFQIANPHEEEDMGEEPEENNGYIVPGDTEDQYDDITPVWEE